MHEKLDVLLHLGGEKGAGGLMVRVAGNGHGDTSSNHGSIYLSLHKALMLFRKGRNPTILLSAKGK